jgi:hypothetical protein
VFSFNRRAGGSARRARSCASLRWLSLALTATFISSPTPLGAINVSPTTQDILRALKLGRSAEGERARFHARYVLPVQDPVVREIEVITEFRRFVLKTEERMRLGDRMFAESVRQAQEALRPSRGRLSVVAHFQFGPLNTYTAVPAVVVLVTGRPEIDAIEGHVTPIWSFPFETRNGSSTYLVGATLQLDFDAASVGQTERPVSVFLDGRELTRATIDFGKLE